MARALTFVAARCRARLSQGRFEEVYCSNSIGGLKDQRSNSERGVVELRDEQLFVNLPCWSTLVFVAR